MTSKSVAFDDGPEKALSSDSPSHSEQPHDSESAEINTRKLLRKLDLKLLPPLALLYLLSFLDRSNGIYHLHNL
jgi:hypothetical protein